MINIFEYPFIYRELNKYLTDNDKLNLILTNKFINSKRKLFSYRQLVEYKNNLENEWFYDNLAVLCVDKIVKLPQRLKYLVVDYQNFTKDDALQFAKLIPRTVKRITLLHRPRDDEGYFATPSFDVGLRVFELSNNISLDNVVELNINFASSDLFHIGRQKKLIISDDSDFNLKIPDSVEKLILSNVYPIKQIPNSVKILELIYKYGFNLKNVIPNSVVDLTIRFDTKVEQLQNIIPNSIKKLNIVGISNITIPDSVINLTCYDFDELESFKMISVTRLTIIRYGKPIKNEYKIPDCVVHHNFSFNLGFQFRFE